MFSIRLFDHLQQNWHRLSIEGAFQDKIKCQEFRDELIELQKQLCIYSKMLADMAGVEDLTDLEKGENNVPQNIKYL